MNRFFTLGLFCVLYAFAHLNAAEVDFTQTFNVRDELNRSGVMDYVTQDGRKLAKIVISNKTDAGLLKITQEKTNGLVIDTREYCKLPGHWVQLQCFREIPVLKELALCAPDTKTAAKIDRISAAMSAEPAGLKMDLFFEGWTTRHFWKRLSVKLTDKDAVYTFDQYLPGDLTKIHTRFDMKEPGVYTIRDVRLTACEPVK